MKHLIMIALVAVAFLTVVFLVGTVKDIIEFIRMRRGDE